MVIPVCADFVCNSFGARESSLSFIRVKISGNEIRALLDSGSSRTFLGPAAIELVQSLGYRFRRARDRRVTTATSQTTRVRGEVEVPLEIENRTRTLSVYALQTLALPCILGMDFLTAFGVMFALGRTRARGLCAGTGDGRRADREGSSRDSAPEEATDIVGHSSSEGEAPTVRAETAQPGGLKELSAEESARLSEFLASEIPGVPAKLGATSLAEHRIDVGGHAPIKQHCYPVSPRVQEAIYAEVDSMLESGIIESSNSAWSTPIVMIKKPNNTYRFCLDFRRLNEVSKKDAYPLPYMNAILDKLRPAGYISTIDLSQAYLQIP
ncbi:uncharacterized protein LOC120357967 [Solenopsis invicta]|uniref:uncharacterized protein LOC120357967 n=1 Tax=Solenopsis invicta TaxID=13686 RepID=UPI00193CF7F4|nr:uncharacterized protein LOC120357967 [Solenopsis invicta]